MSQNLEDITASSVDRKSKIRKPPHVEIVLSRSGEQEQQRMKNACTGTVPDRRRCISREVQDQKYRKKHTSKTQRNWKIDEPFACCEIDILDAAACMISDYAAGLY